MLSQQCQSHSQYREFAKKQKIYICKSSLSHKHERTTNRMFFLHFFFLLYTDLQCSKISLHVHIHVPESRSQKSSFHLICMLLAYDQYFIGSHLTSNGSENVTSLQTTIFESVHTMLASLRVKPRIMGSGNPFLRREFTYGNAASFRKTRTSVCI